LGQVLWLACVYDYMQVATARQVVVQEGERQDLVLPFAFSLHLSGSGLMKGTHQFSIKVTRQNVDTSSLSTHSHPEDTIPLATACAL